ncbi:MAG TPA: type II toxin-antitoxin system VapC family toxin [Candidatus Acidoferrum sp.]|jgi:predicted nucleic acid-binding protein|nr:type II toxin-antitoxin system VapC family toxin [Candidatus Acidoferrum sp.]
MKMHVLDANALYRFLIGGPGADIVAALFRQARDAEQPLRMSVVNWGEVYYTIARVRGFDETSQVMDRVKMLPLTILDANELTTTRAARLKAGYGLPYADCFAAATVAVGDVLVTSDAKDFRKIAGLDIVALPAHKN